MRGGRRWRWLSCGPPCLDLGPVLGWAIIKWVGVMHPHLHLRSDTASGAMPLGLSATSHSASRRPPTNPQRDAKKARMKETRLGNVAVVIATQKGAVRALDRPKKIRPQPAVVLLRRWAVTCHDPATPNAQVATPPSHRTSLALWRWILVRDVKFGGAALFFFLCGVEKRPSLMWRVVVVSGLCARRRAVQIWCGDGPCCDHST